jgi:hypothetical protein
LRGNERKRELSSGGAVGESLSRYANRTIAVMRVGLLSKNFRQYGAWLLIIFAAAAYYPRFIKLPAGM